MNLPEQDPNDEELANMMNDDEPVDKSDSSEGVVEIGIPPEIEDSDSGLDSSEESFSMDDFDSDLSSSSSEPPEIHVSQKIVEPSPPEAVDPPTVSEESSFHTSPVDSGEVIESVGNDSNGVAEFRQSLANLSRQIEIDRLALLHKSLLAKGESLPSLSQIADDIHGKKALFPEGDCDQYSKRPTARLEGWVSGLLFGVSRRAKKFTK